MALLHMAVVPWLKAESQLNSSVGGRIYLLQIPQQITARPCIVVEGADDYDDGTTANLIHFQKFESFCIRVEGKTATELQTPLNLLLAKLRTPITTLQSVIIGGYRCQSLQVCDIVTGSTLYDKQFDDRRQPGAPEQDFCYAKVAVYASYHEHP